MAIADKIKYFRKKKGLTQKDLAEKSGIRVDLITGGHEHSPVEANAEKHIY